MQDWLLLQVEDHPDQTLDTLCSRLLAEKAVSADPSMISLFFQEDRHQLKKTLFVNVVWLRAGRDRVEQDSSDVTYRRNQWRRYQKTISTDRLVFIDETWAKTNMTPTHGWGPRGQPWVKSWIINTR